MKKTRRQLIEENKEVSVGELDQRLNSINFSRQEENARFEQKLIYLEKQNQELKLQISVLVQILATKGISTTQEFELMLEKFKQQEEADKKKQLSADWKANLRLFTLKSEM